MPYKSEKIKLPKEYDRRIKLTDEQKKQIKEEYDEGNTSWSKLAVKYNVSKSLIGLVVNEDRNKKVKEYVKEHWKDFQRSKEYRNESAKKTRRYKQDLYKKGLI